MTIRLLRTLVAISDVQTFSAAAKIVHVTHAAVSQQMQVLEANLGIALFDRSKRTPRLTPVAHLIILKARKLIAEYDDLVPSTVGSGGFDSVITLGALRTTLTGLTPQGMAVLKDKYPHLKLHIRLGLTGPLVADVERGILDAAIVTRPHFIPAGLQFKELAKEQMQLIVAVEEIEDDPFMLLKTRPFIRFNRNAVVGTLIENWIASNRIRVSETMELDSPEAIASMVHANLGVSIVPDLAVRSADGVDVKRISLGTDAPHRSIGLIFQDNHIKMRAILEILGALAKVVRRASSQRRPT